MTTDHFGAEILRCKFFAPEPYSGAVWRKTLLDRILRDPPYRLVVIQAPAGHGKSTLMQQARTLSQRTGVDCGWLSLDEADNDPARFWMHARALVHFASGHAALLGAEHGAAEPRLVQALSNKLASHDGPIRLFFDEFQSLSDEALLSAFRHFLDAMPANVTVYVGTRAIPDLDLPRRVVNNDALVLNADDLRFTAEETGDFFRVQTGPSLTGDDLMRIHRQTDGWPAALHLFRLTLGTSAARTALDQAAPYRSRELADYLAQSVLRSQPPDIQHFMRVTSVLRHLTARLCDALTGRSDSQKVLLSLERSGLFLRCLDTESRWFRYHTLFSSHLAADLGRDDPDLVGQVHRRAAEWFYQEGLHEEALHHAVAARAYPLAADIMAIWSERLIIAGHLGTVERWADELPPDEVSRRPGLAVRIAWAFVFLRRHEKLRALLPVIEDAASHGVDSTVVRSMLAFVVDDMPRAFELAEHAPVQGASDGSFAAFERGAATNVRCYRALASGDMDEAKNLLLQAHSCNLRGNAAFSAGYSGAIKGVSLVLEGRLQEALAHYHTALPGDFRYVDRSLGAAALASCYVHALYEAGDLDAAASLFLQYRDLISDGVLLDFLALGYTTMVRLHDARGDRDAAEQILLEAEQIGYIAGWTRLLRVAAMERARRLLLTGDVCGARKAARRARALPLPALAPGWTVLSEMVEGEIVGRIRIAIHRGQTRYALMLLGPQIAEAERRHQAYRLIKLLVLEALAYQSSGRTNLARRQLLRALQLAAPGGFVRLFADEGERVIDLLGGDSSAFGRGAGSATEPGSVPALVSRIVGEPARPEPDVPTRSETHLIEALTDREKKVLAYVADGSSNGEVAKRIFVSENTVKFHLKNIYSKLAVTNRIQAITTARQLSLLP